MTARYDLQKREDLKPEHQAVWDGIAKARKGAVPAPFQVLLGSPELCRLTGDLGAFCRFRTGLPPRLSELARADRRAALELRVRVHRAQRGSAQGGRARARDRSARTGPPSRRSRTRTPISCIASRPSCCERRDVCEKTYGDAVARFGRQTTVEMSGIIGYYTHLALIMLAHRVPGNPG